jgi:hypothetical protein
MPISLSGSLLITGSITTTGGITISGSILSASYSATSSFSNDFTVLGNLTVFGTQSVQYITSSQLNISDNVITVNVASPGVRFGGLSVFDSGSQSSEATASLFWDSQQNHWIYQRESGSTYDGGMLISGPRNAAGLGNESGTTACMLLVGQGGDHLTSSMIYHSSTATCIPSCLVIGGVLSGSSAAFSSTVQATSYIRTLDRFYAGDGTQVDPSIRFWNSATGLYAPASETLGFVTNTTEKMRITSGGNVGIGTIAPSSVLNSSSTPVLVMKSTTAGAYPSHVLQYINGQEAGITLASALYFDIAGDSTATNNNFIFRTSNTNSCNSLTERMRLTSAGNLGIGCNTPGYTLDVNGNVAATRFWVASGGNATDPMIRVKDDTDTGIYFPSANTMAFSTDAAERIRITSGGVVLVGTTTSAGGVFNTFKTPVNNNYVDQIIVQGAGNYPSLRLGTFDQYDGVIATTGNDLRILSGLNVTTENHSIRLYTSFNGGTTGAQNYERMRIEYNGAVLINTTSIPSNTRFYTALADTEGFRFGNWQSYTYTPNNAWIAENTWFDGNFKRITTGYAYALYSDAASGFQIRVSGTSSTNSLISWLLGITVLPNGNVLNYNNSTTWQQTSDIKIKQNVRPISNVLDKITALNPTHFEYKNKPGQTKTGFIAQEFEQVFPGHVSEFEPSKEYKEYFEEGEKMKSIDADLIPYLVKAIQELSTKLDQANTKIAVLEAK